MRAGELQHMETTFGRDEGPRDTSAEKLANLKPAFQQDGTVTAGNSSQRSDGAAAVVVMDREEAERRGLTPLVRFVGFAVGGVRPEVMGIGPTVAIPKVLEQTGLTMDDIDLIEFNEAFAAQALAVIREVGMDLDKTNVNGGAIALGHPMGATGTKLTVQLIHEMKRRGSKYGLVTMCIGGGMGAAGIFENLQNCSRTAFSRQQRVGTMNEPAWNHQHRRCQRHRHSLRPPRERFPAGAAARVARVLVHWRKNIPVLAGEFDVVAPDLRGFGDTDKPGLPDPPKDLLGNFVEDLRALADALGFERFGVVSHDVGAYVAQGFARKYPERLSGLFFFDCPYPGIGRRWAIAG